MTFDGMIPNFGWTGSTWSSNKAAASKKPRLKFEYFQHCCKNSSNWRRSESLCYKVLWWAAIFKIVIPLIFSNVPLYCCWDCAENFNFSWHWRIPLPKLGCCRLYFAFDVLEAFGDFSYSFFMCSLWMPKTFQDLKGEGEYFCTAYLKLFFRIYFNKRTFSFRSQNLLGHVLPACFSN